MNQFFKHFIDLRQNRYRPEIFDYIFVTGTFLEQWSNLCSFKTSGYVPSFTKSLKIPAKIGAEYVYGPFNKN